MLEEESQNEYRRKRWTNRVYILIHNDWWSMLHCCSFTWTYTKVLTKQQTGKESA